MTPPTVAEIRNALRCEWGIESPYECEVEGGACRACRILLTLDDRHVVIDRDLLAEALRVEFGPRDRDTDELTIPEGHYRSSAEAVIRWMEGKA